jgi:MATE family multidrug resistance protein
VNAAWRRDAATIVRLAWPVFVGQLAVVAFATVDTLLVARYAAPDLAALAVGAAAYITVFIGLMGVVMALGPIVGRLHGAGRDTEAGAALHQAVWLALALAVVGSTVLLWPSPFVALAQPSPEVEALMRGYLSALAFALPAALLFSAYRGFNTAVSRPKAVMALQLAGLAAKVPLSAALVFGVPALGLPALGVRGCGIATAVVMWLQVAVALWVLRRDAFYAPFALRGRGLDRPDAQALRAQLRLGLPMGGSILIGASGLSLMALFIARLGTVPVAGHQIAANLSALLFMMPLALANATSTLVAQRIGARELHHAHRLGWHGLQLALMVALAMGGAVFLARAGLAKLYTREPAVVAAALPLLAWVALFHVADAAQAVLSFVLRAWHVATLPMFVFAASQWGVGLGGGTVLAFGGAVGVPAALQGAIGYWVAVTAGLVLSSGLLGLLLARTLRQQRAGAAVSVAA